MKHLADLLRAIAALAWPAFAVWVFHTYNEEIRGLLRRLKKGKLFGQEIELEEPLKKLEQDAKKAKDAVPAIEGIAYAKDTLTTNEKGESSANAAAPAEEQRAKNDDEIEKILSEAGRSPKAALLLLAAQVEKKLRDLLLGTGWNKGRRIDGIRQGVDILGELELIHPTVISAARAFTVMRSRLIHGHVATDDDILRAIDSGITILRTLEAIPHSVPIVYYPCAKLFYDREGQKPVEGVCGLMFETLKNPLTNEYMILPTLRNDYKRGQRLSWEFNRAKTFPTMWYEDPDSGAIKAAWGYSTEFVGRDLDSPDQIVR